MADSFKTEEEQIEDIKRWWKENGRAVIAGLVIGIGGIAGVRYWGEYQTTQAQQASAAYEQMQQSIIVNDAQTATQQGEAIMRAYASSPYASMSALALAKQAVDQNMLDSATAHLQWVVDNGHDEEFKHIARQRLARVLLAQKKHDQAKALITGIELGSYVSIYEEIRGDVLLAQGQTSQAREKYRIALAAETQNQQRRQLLQMKLDDLALAVNQEAQQ